MEAMDVGESEEREFERGRVWSVFLSLFPVGGEGRRRVGDEGVGEIGRAHV